MSYYVGITLLFFVALIEVSVLPLFRVYGLQPNLTLVLLVAWLIIRGEEEAYVLIPIGGVLLGLVESAPMGTAIIALAPVAVLQEIRGSKLGQGGIAMAIAFAAVMSVVYNFTYLLVFTLTGESGNWLVATTDVVLPVTLLNIVVLVPLYFVFSVVNPRYRRSLYA
jgi:rod shape-determining protein MreD